MAATASLPSSSLPSSSVNSSHSSEGSCGFVVVEKSSSFDENARVLQINAGDKRDMKFKSESLLEAGSPPDDDLIERVQNLTKENDELKGVLTQNNKLLEEYFQDLAGMQKNQKQTLRKGYENAKEMVKKVREKNESLKTELKSEQAKNQQLEEQLLKLREEKQNQSSPQLDDDPSSAVRLQSLDKEIKRLESEKAMLEINNSKLQEHISCLRSLREAEQNVEVDECEALLSSCSLTSPTDQASMESIRGKCSKLETEKEILLVDLQKLKIENEQVQEQYRRVEEDYNVVLKKLTDTEQNKVLDDATAVATGQASELSHQLQAQTETLSRLQKELDEVKQDKETYKKKVEEIEEELTKERSKGRRKASQTERAGETILHGEPGEEPPEPENAGVSKLKEEIIVLTRERDSYKKKLDAFQTHLEAAKASAEDAFGDVEVTEMYEKYLDLKRQVLMFEKREAEMIARENVLYREKEEAQRKEIAENEEIERLKQVIQNYEEKGREAREAAKQQMASQAKLGNEIGELRQQIETERSEFRKQLDNLMQERDTYKMKAEELQTPTVVDSKPSKEEVFGDADLKERFTKVTKQLWNYQKRENAVQDRENAVLEKEEAYKQLLNQNKDLQRQLTELTVKEKALTQEKQKHVEQSRLLQRQLSETHEQQVLVLKEKLQNKNEAMAAVQTSEERLKQELAQLQQENQGLLFECEIFKADCSKKEEETELVKRQLSETHQQALLLLKEEFRNKELALETAQSSEEHLKAQVTQLIQENQALVIELERLKEDLQQQENMYQDHLHKMTKDSEQQRKKRDDIIKNMKAQLGNAERELQKSRALLDTNHGLICDLKNKEEKLMAEYRDLVQNYNTALDANKEYERNAEREKSEKDELDRHLREADGKVQKLKEDIRMKDEEISDLEEHMFHLKKMEEQFPILNTQLEVYQGDFEVEREAREKQHDEILRLREEIQRLEQENRYYQDQMDRLGSSQMLEMQRRHGSYEPREQEPQQPRGWFFPLFSGYEGQQEIPRNPEGRRQEGPGDVQQEEDWICPTCRRTFPDFNALQLHAVECNAAQQAPANQCPKCLEIFPDMDTLNIHFEDCLD